MAQRWAQKHHFKQRCSVSWRDWTSPSNSYCHIYCQLTGFWWLKGKGRKLGPPVDPDNQHRKRQDGGKEQPRVNTVMQPKHPWPAGRFQLSQVDKKPAGAKGTQGPHCGTNTGVTAVQTTPTAANRPNQVLTSKEQTDSGPADVTEHLLDLPDKCNKPSENNFFPLFLLII